MLRLVALGHLTVAYRKGASRPMRTEWQECKPALTSLSEWSESVFGALI